MAGPSSMLERDVQLETLQRALDRAADGTGSVALVYGEAGIGKTTLVDTFSERASAAGVSVLCGKCDALRTPRPLGPLLDIARSAGGRLKAVAGGEPDRERLFAAFLDVLHRQRPAGLVVVEDVHWTDVATLDLLTFLGRRIGETRTLLVVTFRDDELPADHPLRDVLDTLPRDTVRRIPLPRLSRGAVENLAREAGLPAADLYELTSGNPFYVIEALAEEGEVSQSVQDAVFARAASLPTSARRVLDAVALAPRHVERWLLDAVLDPDPEDVRACVDRGVLVSADGDLAFRHELTRRAWLGQVDQGRARRLHSRLLGSLESAAVAGRASEGRSREGARGEAPVEAGRLVHHAAGAEEEAAVLRLAPVAAAEAARLGAHSEAAVHYGAALDAAHDVEPVQRAELLESLARECYLVGQNEEAVSALGEALEIRRALDDSAKQSEDERWLARLAWFRGDEPAVRRHCRAAIEAAEPLGPSPELARACALHSQILMCAEECHDAVDWGERALAMARSVDDPETVVHSLINIGCATLLTGDPSGRQRLDEALAAAREEGLHDGEARALLNLAEIAVAWRDVGRAAADIEAAVSYCTDRDMDPYALCAIGARARLHLWTGDWSEAASDASLVLGHRRVPPVDRVPALVVVGLLRSRRGDPGTWEALDEARALAAPTGELHRLAPVAAARAEAAWLEDGPGRVVGEVRTAYRMARERANPWVTGELALALWRAGELSVPPENAAEPYALQMAGDLPAAADAWDRLGFPYRKALALSERDDPSAARDGLRILRELEATRTADRVASQLRNRGIEHLPRGPRSATRANPAGLTRRQLEVLNLLAEGLSNRQIAGQLHISPKTVETHVSAVLAKLDVSNRTEAALRAAEMS